MSAGAGKPWEAVISPNTSASHETAQEFPGLFFKVV
jgi:hypothetical protein